MAPMPLPLPARQLKAYIRQVYQRLAAAGSANLTTVAVASGENLARAFGYEPEALALPEITWQLFAGCGNPLKMISIEPYWTVVDLGCGIGIDCQLAALSLRRPGRAVGIDLTPELLHLARRYSPGRLALPPDWLAADGEHLPLRPETAHLVVANGSFNLMPNKEQTLVEIHRVLHPGGYLALADLLRLSQEEMPGCQNEDAWAWCVAGALTIPQYGYFLRGAGFSWWQLEIKCSYGPLAAAQLLARKQGLPGQLLE